MLRPTGYEYNTDKLQVIHELLLFMNYLTSKVIHTENQVGID